MFDDKTGTIQEIVLQGFCIGCGTCAALCPNDALRIVECPETGTYIPQLDAVACTKCGLCLKVCPGIETDFGKKNSVVSDQTDQLPFMGGYLHCYSGYAADRNTRCASASGGLVSALSAYALKTGFADGVLATRANSRKPLRPQSFIARTSNEVFSSSGSKYCPVPVNSSLSEILKDDGHYIVIGLPCQIQGLRKAQALNRELKTRISLVFGLVCNHTPSFHATDFLLRRHKIPIGRMAKLDYRSSGWPGYMKIVTTDHSECFIPFNSSYYWGYVFQKFFWPKRCLVCNDKLCQLADIIFMDAWLPEFSSNKTGYSLVVARSPKGDALISQAVKEGIVNLKRIPIEDVLRSQQMHKVIRRAVITRFALKYPPITTNPSTAQVHAPTPSILNLIDAFHLLSINTLFKKPSKISRIIIETHVRLWNIALSIKAYSRKRGTSTKHVIRNKV